MNGNAAIADTGRVPARQVVEDAAAAMQQLCKSVASLEDGLIAANAFETRSGHDQPNPLQKLDAIFQMSEEMAHLLRRLADQLPSSTQVALDPVVAPVRLEKLRAVFDGSAAKNTQTNSDTSSPSVLLF